MSAPARVDRLVTETALRAPDSAALRHAGTTWNYARLDAAADGIAAALCDGGVQHGDRVAVWLDKSHATIATAYGIQRAGAVFVPLDPKAPDGRMGAIVRDAAPTAVVTDPKRHDRIRTELGTDRVARVVLEAGTSLDAAINSDSRPPSRSIDGDDLAYVLYTSGSTGTPKGVMVRHRNAMAFVRWAADAVGLRADDICSQHAPLNFDLSTFDLYAAALAGACCSIVDPMAALFPVKLADWIRREHVSVWYSVPSALTLLVQRGGIDNDGLASLRTVIFAGEVFSSRWLHALMTAVPQATYWNWYGPTETNVCTAERITTAPAPDAPPVPIGAACGECSGLVVSADGTEVTGTGAEGELWIRGGTVAAGYWGDPERSAAGFVTPDTYRTGDLVRILDDSPTPRYAYLGRSDDMIKTRGYRVELGEVDAGLLHADIVTDAAAIALPDDTIGARIVAFCTVDTPHVDRPADDVVRDILTAARTRLPAYMLPEELHIVAALPRTANGKVDRRRLTADAAEHHRQHPASLASSATADTVGGRP